MAFLDDVDELKSKAGVGTVPLPARIGIIALAVALAVAAVIGIVLPAGGGFTVEKGASSPSAATAQASQVATGGGASESQSESTAQSAQSGTCYVYVVGAVRQPGVYEVDASARVNDVVQAAGGLKPEADDTAVNLAREVVDGEQIAIPTKEETAAAAEAQAQAGASAPSAVPGTSSASAAGTGSAAASAAQQSGITADGKVNINTATAKELETLPGIGEVTAGKIIASREAEGAFQTAEDLKRVSGIGDKKYAAVADMITV